MLSRVEWSRGWLEAGVGRIQGVYVVITLTVNGNHLVGCSLGGGGGLVGIRFSQNAAVSKKVHISYYNPINYASARR